MIVDLTDKTYNTYVSAGVTIVDVYAPWCPPCQKFLVILPRLESAIQDIAKIGKLNYDDFEAFADNLGVESVPTFIVYKNGVEKERWSGIKTITEIENILRTT